MIDSYDTVEQFRDHLKNIIETEYTINELSKHLLDVISMGIYNHDDELFDEIIFDKGPKRKGCDQYRWEDERHHKGYIYNRKDYLDATSEYVKIKGNIIVKIVVALLEKGADIEYVEYTDYADECDEEGEWIYDKWFYSSVVIGGLNNDLDEIFDIIVSNVDISPYINSLYHCNFCTFDTRSFSHILSAPNIRKNRYRLSYILSFNPNPDIPVDCIHDPYLWYKSEKFGGVLINYICGKNGRTKGGKNRGLCKNMKRFNKSDYKGGECVHLGQRMCEYGDCCTIVYNYVKKWYYILFVQKQWRKRYKIDKINEIYDLYALWVAEQILTPGTPHRNKTVEMFNDLYIELNI